MADRETVERLRTSGQRAWNAWRREQAAPANLRRATLGDLDLGGRNLAGADLTDADLSRSRLDNAELSGASLRGADLTGCHLASTHLPGASLVGADMREAFAETTSFNGADLTEADLTGADLSHCQFVEAIFRSTILDGTSLDGGLFGETVFAGVDLSSAGLGYAEHEASSVLDHRTLATCANVDIDFLRGCGLPDALIDRIGELFGGVRYQSCFISYSQEDRRFVDKLSRSLRGAGVHHWRDTERVVGSVDLDVELTARIGDYERLVLVASLHALRRDDVRFEVEAALGSVDEPASKVVPLMIDPRVPRSKSQLAGLLSDRRLTYIDFTQWETRNGYARGLRHLLRSLEVRG